MEAVMEENPVEIDNTPTPEDFSNVINETITPGTLGLVEDDNKEEVPVNAAQALQTVTNLAKHMGVFAQDLMKNAQTGNVREVRKTLTEILGATMQAKKEADALAKHYGLPDIAV